MDLENGTEVYASTFLKLNIYRDCDFINKYLMTRYDKRNYLHRYDMNYLPVLMSCYVYFYLYRCGMVFVDPEELKWLPFTQTWMNGYADKVKDEIREYILDLFVRYVDDGLTFIRKKCQQSINQVMLYVYLWIFIESIKTCITVIIESINVCNGYNRS